MPQCLIKMVLTLRRVACAGPVVPSRGCLAKPTQGSQTQAAGGGGPQPGRGGRASSQPAPAAWQRWGKWEMLEDPAAPSGCPQHLRGPLCPRRHAGGAGGLGEGSRLQPGGCVCVCVSVLCYQVKATHTIPRGGRAPHRPSPPRGCVCVWGGGVWGCVCPSRLPRQGPGCPSPPCGHLPFILRDRGIPPPPTGAGSEGRYTPHPQNPPGPLQPPPLP